MARGETARALRYGSLSRAHLRAADGISLRLEIWWCATAGISSEASLGGGNAQNC